RILSIEPIDDGSVIHLDLVNLLSIPVSNLAFNMTWGTKKPSEVPSESAPIYLQRLEYYRRLYRPKEEERG
ncbi:hypothetical protein KU617_23745, partial [Salmonella enterica subsp. enterica serovar Montevideo]|nr:hypothetical protein [Salmonella enterica subsp. enterica serovar Montevideo]